MIVDGGEDKSAVLGNKESLNEELNPDEHDNIPEIFDESDSTNDSLK